MCAFPFVQVLLVKFPLRQWMGILCAQKMRQVLTALYVARMDMTSQLGPLKTIIVPMWMVSGIHLTLLSGLTVLVRFMVYFALQAFCVFVYSARLANSHGNDRRGQFGQTHPSLFSPPQLPGAIWTLCSGREEENCASLLPWSVGSHHWIIIVIWINKMCHITHKPMGCSTPLVTQSPPLTLHRPPQWHA